VSAAPGPGLGRAAANADPAANADAATLAVDVVSSAGAFTVAASFTAKEGITALFGPSGAGKSVTLATIAGLIRPQRGTIELRGRLVADAGRGVHVPTQERKIGMVFQHAALLPHRSPLDNVALAVRAGGRRQRRAEAREYLAQVHASSLADASTANLSGGEQQRVALARAIAGRPEVLLLDEPFSALDQPTRRALRDLVRTLVDAHRLTALVVTHDLDDITHLADRVVRFEPGRTVDAHDLPVPARELPALLGVTSDAT